MGARDSDSLFNLCSVRHNDELLWLTIGLSFRSRRPHPAEEVYVTGTFDNWEKTEELQKVGDSFEKKVKLPVATDKIYYKFVVDGAWTTDHTAPQETDSQGNVNNVLLPKDMSKIEDASDPAAALISSVGPESTTAQLAAAVPLEDKPVEAKPAEEKAEDKPVEVTAPGGYPETPLADLDKAIKVDPLPAANGAVNPIDLALGEKIPDEVKAGSTTDNVTLDKESYEKSDRLPGVDTSLGNEAPVVDKEDVTINTVGPESTTAALAGEVPLEPKVPEIVKQSQEEAKVDPEASAIPEEVREKAEVEAELLKVVPEAPAVGEKTLSETVTAAATAASAAVLSAGAGAFAAAKGAADKLPAYAQDVLSPSPERAVPQEVTPAETPAIETPAEIAPEVPAEVKDSIKAAGETPEAAANPVAVEEKKEVEAELLKKVEEVKPAVTEAPVKVEEPKLEPKVEESKVEPKVEEPKAAPAAATETPAAPAVVETNGTKAVADAPASTSTEAAPAKPDNAAAGETVKEKKKRHRISAFFSKIKHKIQDH
ncbi:hypothetical protein QBC34DRAFT_302178 [Podospora aff. communis PSN243]|uniref:AMP-activated protein kinase glycogen-binding domain-containing protein n=1 Tax=Podospora aff. communis PSN243 TaxID=3040156 RepID=A0AAV9GJR8_9PEZI|nr:hypothetical protein QBC34DRAFT_302178 [Podospora aff. communis PSN243]